MLDLVLRLFPPRTHPLNLASDPDRVLAGEEVAAALAERGFALLEEPDPVRLRHRVERARPFSLERPLVVATEGAAKDLPYDLWQQGHHVGLALHALFPNLAYPLLQSLSPARRSGLGRAPLPAQPLGRQATADYLLRHLFDADPEALRRPAGLIAWLNGYHARRDPMPPELGHRLLDHLRAAPAYAAWPLADLLGSREALAAFLAEQWQGYLRDRSGAAVAEEQGGYLLAFDGDPHLQDTLPALVRTGVLEPTPVERPEDLPMWARPALLAGGEDRAGRRAAELLGLLEEGLPAEPEGVSWSAWQALARAWAELTALAGLPGPALSAEQRAAVMRLAPVLDGAFLAWLRRYYSPLGGCRLPMPHHVHHLPHYLAYRRRQGDAGRVALLVMDGMALSDWQVIGEAWRRRHPDWSFRELLVLAQVPTITAVSRQAMVAGRRPADFAATLEHNQAEPRQWGAFWEAEGFPAGSWAYARLGPAADDLPAETLDPRVHALCLVHTGVDDLAHGATLGGAAVRASLPLWLEGPSVALEAALSDLLARGFALFLASDHGHVEARGLGQPSEGLRVRSRSQRARLYEGRPRAEGVRQLFPGTVLWGGDGLLPDNLWALLPAGRQAFAPAGETVVTHGGPTLDEVVVPLVAITRR